MRKSYIDNIRWITVVLVVIYHIIYMFNGVTTFAVIGPFSDNQPQDIYMYIVYPWFMLLLFTISGMSARFYLENHSDNVCVGNRCAVVYTASVAVLPAARSVKKDRQRQVLQVYKGYSYSS